MALLSLVSYSVPTYWLCVRPGLETLVLCSIPLMALCRSQFETLTDNIYTNQQYMLTLRYADGTKYEISSSRWGWVNVLDLAESKQQTAKLYAGAADCDITKVWRLSVRVHACRYVIIRACRRLLLACMLLHVWVCLRITCA